jgi:steroid delta-isomerase-like uncharacterized protein
MSEENKAIVRRIFDEVWGAHREDRVEAYFATDLVQHPELPGLGGFEGVKASVRMFAAAISDDSNVIEDMIAEGDRVAIRWSATGTHTGELLGIAATGKPIVTTAITIYRFRDGKVVEGWTEYNSLEMMQRLGVIPQLGG